MTRQQIVQMTQATGRLVSTNKAGVAPRNEKHAKRLAELKVRKKLTQDNPEPQRQALRA
jgi:hypothetical protein